MLGLTTIRPQSGAFARSLWSRSAIVKRIELRESVGYLFRCTQAHASTGEVRGCIDPANKYRGAMAPIFVVQVSLLAGRSEMHGVACSGDHSSHFANFGFTATFFSAT